MEQEFIQDLITGLKAETKRIPSKYLYDERGSRLFQKITEQPEYYLTAAERNIFERSATDIINKIKNQAKGSLQILELGAGDGHKTEFLLDEIERLKYPSSYEPADIDPSVLNQLELRLKDKYEFIKIRPRPGYNDDALKEISSETSSLILFLGSNIGNYSKQDEADLIKRIGKAMKSGDQLLLGADRAKSPHVIAPAYNDKNKVTEAFTRNIIHRMNRVLNAKLNPESFEFYSFYDPQDKEVRAFLITKEKQHIAIKDVVDIILPPWTVIQTETSRKYELEDLIQLGANAGLSLKEFWKDSNEYFFELLYIKE